MAGQVSPWRTKDNGETWYPIPNGMEILVQSRVTADTADPRQVMRSWQGTEVGRVMRTIDLGVFDDPADARAIATFARRLRWTIFSPSTATEKPIAA